jgi:ATP-binding cassette subfamily B protein
MLRDLRPLFAYMRRYRWSYLWGSLSVVGTNAVWVLFPRVLQQAIDELNHNVTHRRILMFAGILVAIALVKGVFLYAQRWICFFILKNRILDFISAIAPATLWPGSPTI